MPDLQKMIQVLLDKSVDIATRDDVAMDLASYPYDNVMEALHKAAVDPDEDVLVAASCGESLGEMMVARNKLEWDYLKLILPVAYREAYEVIKREKPEWIEKLLKGG